MLCRYFSFSLLFSFFLFAFYILFQALNVIYVYVIVFGYILVFLHIEYYFLLTALKPTSCFIIRRGEAEYYQREYTGMDDQVDSF